MKDYHEILGVGPNADKETLKKAYRKLAMDHHPDRGGDQEKFTEITEAYETLTGQREPSRQHQPPPGNPFNFGDFFYQQRAPRQQPRPPLSEDNIPVRVQMNAQDIIDGRIGNIKYTLSEDCKSCDSSGGEGKSTCGRCSGMGSIVHEVVQFGMRMRNEQSCPHCSGEGVQFVKKCVDCHGKGWQTVDKNLTFNIKVI